jgi:hypothetical protein
MIGRNLWASQTYGSSMKTVVIRAGSIYLLFAVIGRVV